MRGLAGTVEAQDDDPRALVDGQVDVGEDLERAVGLRQLLGGDRGLAARGGSGELDPRHLVGSALALEPGHHLLGALEHRLRGGGLRGLGAHPVGLVGEGLGLGLGVGTLALAATLVGLALGEVVLPAHVVDVDRAAVGVEVHDLVDGRLEQLVVVADHDQAAAVVLEEVAQPDDRVGVEVVGRLVEEQRLGAGEQDAGELDPAALATGERLELLGQDAGLDAEAARDLRGLGLSGIAAAGVQLGVGARPALHPALVGRDVLGGHLLLGLTHPAYDVVEAARRQDPVACEDLGIADARVLREVADLAARDDLAGGGKGLPGQDLGEGGLAGAVATDEPDLVTGGDTERDVLHEEAGARADFELLGVDHQAVRISVRRRFPLIVVPSPPGRLSRR